MLKKAKYSLTRKDVESSSMEKCIAIYTHTVYKCTYTHKMLRPDLIPFKISQGKKKKKSAVGSCMAQACRLLTQGQAIPSGGQGVPKVLSTFYLWYLIKEMLTNINISREEQKTRSLGNVSHKEWKTQWPKA